MKTTVVTLRPRPRDALSPPGQYRAAPAPASQLGALRDAKEVLQAATRQAQRTARDAADEARRLLESAAEKGFRAGVELLANELRHCEELRKCVIAESSTLLSTLVFRIAETVVGQLAHQHPTFIQEQVESALSTMSEPPITILVHPDDCSHFSHSLHSIEGGTHTQIEFSPELRPQTARILSATHSLHLDWQSFLERLRAEISPETLAEALRADLEERFEKRAMQSPSA